MTSRWCLHPFKRLLDCSTALLMLCLLTSVIGAISVLVMATMGRPVFFCQVRSGRAGVPFMLWKFRTMAAPLDSAGHEIPEGDRITRLGRWLRSSSLDELPQLMHVVQGTMSLVGPRPLLPRYLDRYSPAQRRRLTVRPGLTGLAQTQGRNSLIWEQRFRLDVVYVESASFLLDARIICRTIVRLLRPTGISAVGHPTSPEFLGAPIEGPDRGAAPVSDHQAGPRSES